MTGRDGMERDGQLCLVLVKESASTSRNKRIETFLFFVLKLCGPHSLGARTKQPKATVVLTNMRLKRWFDRTRTMGTTADTVDADKECRGGRHPGLIVSLSTLLLGFLATRNVSAVRCIPMMIVTRHACTVPYNVL